MAEHLMTIGEVKKTIKEQGIVLTNDGIRKCEQRGEITPVMRLEANKIRLYTITEVERFIEARKERKKKKAA